MKERGSGTVRFFSLPNVKHLQVVRGSGVTHDFPRHVHSSLCMGIVDRGERAISHGRKSTVVSAGGLFVVNPGESHTCRTRENSYRILCAGTDLVQSVTQQMSEKAAGLPHFDTVLLSDKGLVRQINRFFWLIDQGTAAAELESCFIALLSRLILKHSQRLPVPGRIDSCRREVKRAREFIEANYSRNLSLEQLAQAACLSPFHFQRVFRRYLGVSPHEYLIQFRIRKAKEYLREGAPLTQVALDTGFVDQSHFTRHFKRAVGVPPGRYLLLQTNESTGRAVRDRRA